MSDVNDRFWSKADCSGGPKACWPWLACCRPDGYGAFSLRGRARKANRVAWELTRGPVPPGQLVLHSCDNRLCVNPEHLWLGTHDDNMADMARKGRGTTVAGDHIVAEARKLYAAGGVTQAELGRKFGVSREVMNYWIREKYRRVA